MNSFNIDKKTYVGTYKNVPVCGFGCMIGNNWYGNYYCTKKKNGKNYKVKESTSNTINDIKNYIETHINELI